MQPQNFSGKEQTKRNAAAAIAGDNPNRGPRALAIFLAIIFVTAFHNYMGRSLLFALAIIIYMVSKYAFFSYQRRPRRLWLFELKNDIISAVLIAVLYRTHFLGFFK
jgi:hypothetical protein